MSTTANRAELDLTLAKLTEAAARAAMLDQRLNDVQLARQERIKAAALQGLPLPEIRRVAGLTSVRFGQITREVRSAGARSAAA